MLACQPTTYLLPPACSCHTPTVFHPAQLTFPHSTQCHLPQLAISPSFHFNVAAFSLDKSPLIIIPQSLCLSLDPHCKCGSNRRAFKLMLYGFRSPAAHSTDCACSLWLYLQGITHSVVYLNRLMKLFKGTSV